MSLLNSIKSILHHPYLAIVLRVILGGVLIFAGSLKIFDMASFADSIENYQFIPLWGVNFVAIVLPPIEIITGVCLIFGVLYQGALLISTGMFLVFFAAINWALINGINIECGCFGTATGTTIGLQSLFRNTLFLLALAPLWLQQLSKSSDTSTENDYAESYSSSPQVEPSTGDGV